jgi:hypothetical protein
MELVQVNKDHLESAPLEYSMKQGTNESKFNLDIELFGLMPGLVL